METQRLLAWRRTWCMCAVRLTCTPGGRQYGASSAADAAVICCLFVCLLGQLKLRSGCRPSCRPHLLGASKACPSRHINAMMATYLESSFDQSLSRLGGVFDIIKCFNALPRAPLLWMLLHLGVNPCYVHAYENMLSSFTRTFLFQGVAGVSEHSETGFPEGCTVPTFKYMEGGQRLVLTEVV